MTSWLQRSRVWFLALGIVVTPWAAARAQSPSYQMQWGSLGGAAGNFRYPSGIASDASGYVYVADQFNNRIQKFTRLGAFVETWGWGVATGTPAYEICTSGCRAGIEGTGNGQFRRPDHLRVDGGVVYVVDTDNDRVQKLTTSGTYLAQWGSNGYNEGQFRQPEGVATDASGNVYIVDSGNHRIQKFTNAGTFLEMRGWGVATGAAAYEICTSGCQLGISGTGNGQFYGPNGVATDATGNLYVGDQQNNRIQKFDGNGIYLSQWGSSGTSETQFNGLGGIVTDAAGHVYVAEMYNNRLDKFTSTGAFVEMWGWGVTTGAAAYEICASGCRAGIPGNNDGQFRTPVDQAIDGSGNLYIVDSSNHRIQKFSTRCLGSTCPSALSVSPDGTCCFDVVVRDCELNPIPSSVVVVHFDNCSISFCPTQPPGVAVNEAARTATAVTNALGIAHFCICASVTSSCNATIEADGVLLCSSIPVLNCATANLSCSSDGVTCLEQVTPVDGSGQPLVVIEKNGIVQIGVDADCGDPPCSGICTVTPTGQPSGASWPTIDGPISAGSSRSIGPFTTPGNYTYTASCSPGIAGTIHVKSPPVSVGSETSPDFTLDPARPNPSTGQIVISFSLPIIGPAMIEIYDVIGRRQRHWTWSSLMPGRHEVSWDGRSDDGRFVTPGVLFCRLRANGRTLTQKLSRWQ